MANTISTSPVQSEYHTIAEEFYNRLEESPLANPDYDLPYFDAFAGAGFVQGYSNNVKSTTLNQHILGTVGDEWYNKIHIMPSASALGNLFSSQKVEIEVWNGFFAPHTLNSITEAGTDGMVLTEPGSTPLAYATMESKIYTLNVATIGPPNIDGSYTFVFDIYSIVFYVTGYRVVVFPLIPQRDFTETLEWKTDIIKTKTAEQRIALRNLPRQSFQLGYLLDEVQFSKAKAIMTGWAERLFGVPMWSDREYIGSVSADAESIPVNTTIADYTLDGLAILFQDEFNFEAVEILVLNSGSIDIKTPVVGNYTAAFLMPVTLANAVDGMSFSRTPDNFISGKTNYLSVITNDLSCSEEVQYKGVDIILDPSVYVSSMSEKVFRDVATLDSTLGRIVLDQTRDHSEHNQTLSFDTLTKEALWKVRQWIHSRKGKQKTFYIPSWNDDLSVQVDIVAADTSLTVTDIKYSLYFETKDIIILKNDGSYLLREASGATDIGDGTELITLTSAIGEDITISQIDKVCFVSHVRFNSDRVEIKHRTNREASIVIPITEVPA